MRQTRFAIAMFVCVVSVVSVFAQTTRPTIQTYKNPQHGFQMDYLTTWKPEAEGSKPWIVTRFVPASPNDARLSRAIIGMPTPAQKPASLDDIAKFMLDEMKSIIPDATIGIASDSTLANEKARRMIVTGNSAGENPVPVRALVIATIHKDKPYVVGIFAPVDEWTRLREGFDRLVTSFTFIEPTK